jgi:hypothetical protein
MNFDACGANNAVLGNALSTGESELSQVELCGCCSKESFTDFGGNNQRKYLPKVIIYVK